MWESRVVCGISKRGGNGGKVGGRTFPRFPRRVISAANPQLCPFWRKCGGWRAVQDQILVYRKPHKMPTSSESRGEPPENRLSTGRIHDQGAWPEILARG